MCSTDYIISDRSVCKTAVLLATDVAESLGAMVERVPACLLSLAGRPLADRMAGLLSDLGIERLLVFATHSSDALTEFFDDGTRWGLQIQVIDVRKSARVIERLQAMRETESFLVGSMFCLPNLQRTDLEEWFRAGTVCLRQNDRSLDWAVLTPERVAQLNPNSSSGLFEQLATDPSVVAADPILSCQSARELLESTGVLLRQEVERQHINGASVDAGIWIGAGTVIHPEAQLIPPVWIGENCRLDRATRLGPNVCLEAASIVGAHSTLENAIVFSNTVMGEHLELEDAVVDRNYIAYMDSEQPVAIPDRFLIASNREVNPARWIGSMLGRLAAWGIFLACSPLFLFVYLCGRLSGVSRPVVTRSCLRLPSQSDRQLWKTARHHRWSAAGPRCWQRWVTCRGVRALPALFDIALGRLHWVGLAPRSAEEVNALQDDWRMLYLRSVCGLFELAELDRRAVGDYSPEQLYSSEAFYAATRTVRFDFEIIGRSLRAMCHRAPTATPPAILWLVTGEAAFDQLHGFLRTELNKRRELLATDRMHEITTAIHEAVANITRHSYENASGRSVQVQLAEENERIVIDLYDLGKPFDPMKVPEPKFTIESEGGFGWYLINRIADAATYSHMDSGWNRLVLSFGRTLKGEK